MKYIDLGLSVLWADCNIGANSPEEYGEYYAWDDIPNEFEIPTKEQQSELRTKCDWTWTTQNGVKGYKVTSKKNGNSIFLPAVGCRGGGDYNAAVYGGHYWSSSLVGMYNSYDAYYLGFNAAYWDYYYGRCYGRSVRAVCE